ncbi:hypothetical protein KIN20_023053 [Parelaphostrongylus tenuis]|uniref:Uncharacterized protein n=1 Tax=Parelaphostrongylus tenuis TaxID=148309 RepID=A0AAD5N656_PARTN|nr:hypothetical protein KIN20_023053 [Parelaphostrongylus tenuis]
MGAFLIIMDKFNASEPGEHGSATRHFKGKAATTRKSNASQHKGQWAAKDNPTTLRH